MSQGPSRRGYPAPDAYYDPQYEDASYGYGPPPPRRQAPPMPAPPQSSWTAKLGYAGVGFVVGVIVAPTVRRVLEDARPRIDSLFDRLTGSAEKLAENASDFMAAARTRVRSGGEGGQGGHSH